MQTNPVPVGPVQTDPARPRIWSAAILGLGLVVGAAVFGLFFYQSRLPVKTISVVGTATTRVQSDIVKWRITLARTVGPQNLKSGYAAIKGDMQALQDLMTQAGLDLKDFTTQPATANQIYNPKGAEPLGYRVTQSGFLISRNIPAVQKLALNPETLANAGLEVQSSSLEYYISDLGQIKRKLLAEATVDARQRAEQIAKSSGDTVAFIQSARQGVFQITEPYSTDISDYGIYNTGTLEKDISVTVNAQFGLR
ncbi:MAG: SIMPL domain-containing protein [Firmicutes bacterium]|nr:SIMPL domain-containing protein [Bacillota bacterium]